MKKKGKSEPSDETEKEKIYRIKRENNNKAVKKCKELKAALIQEKKAQKKELEDEKTFLERSIKSAEKKYQSVKIQANLLGFSENEFMELVQKLSSSTNNEVSDDSDDDDLISKAFKEFKKDEEDDQGPSNVYFNDGDQIMLSL